MFVAEGDRTILQSLDGATSTVANSDPVQYHLTVAGDVVTACCDPAGCIVYGISP